MVDAVIFLEDQLDLLDALICEGQGSVVLETIYPDHPVFRFESDGQVVDEVFVDAQRLGDVRDGVDVVHLVALHGQAATGWVIRFWAFQFQGSSSSIR